MHVQFGNYTCHLLFSTYKEHENIAIQLVDERDGQPVATATLNPEMKLDEGLVCINNHSKNKGMLDVLIHEGIVSSPVSWYQTGFVVVPVCQLLIPVFEEEEDEWDGK